MSSSSPGSDDAPPQVRAASAALAVSIVSLLTSPLWIVAGIFFKGGTLFFAALPGVLSLVLGFRALQLAATAVPASGNKRGSVSLVLGLLSLVISLASSGFGMMLAGFKLGKMDGRALRIRGRTVTAQGTQDDSWAVDEAPAVPVEDPETRAALAATWEADARTEHASIAAFARLSLDLMAAGAPPHLIEASLGAALDEVLHAKGAYSLASAYAGHSLGPGRMPEVATDSGGLSRLAMETVIDGCLGEGWAAACAREAAVETVDPVIKAHLSAVARDERRHAELAWDVLAFCLTHGGASARLATERALKICARGALPVPASTPALDGRLSPARIASLGLSVRREVEARARQLCAGEQQLMQYQRASSSSSPLSSAPRRSRAAAPSPSRSPGARWRS